MTAQIRVCELFAGVGGFRLALDGHSDPKWGIERDSRFATVWMNQWEPSTNNQFAFECYKARFANEPGDCVMTNEDIHKVVGEVIAGTRDLPEFDMLVGGFPCQDYSVAKGLKNASGLEGKKGVLWWDLYDILRIKQPKYLLLENVDRLLKSPSSNRGRDFAVMLSCLAKQGYSVEWRVINAADYGAPQKRRRVFIFAERNAGKWQLSNRVFSGGIIARAFPVLKRRSCHKARFYISKRPEKVSEMEWGQQKGSSPFFNAGSMQDGVVYTAEVKASYEGKTATLSSILSKGEVPEEFFVSNIEKWKSVKGAHRIKRKASKSDYEYLYSEGAISFPDNLSKPARTILTSEGGSGASRTKHIIKVGHRYRRLLPEELERLQGFPPGWTNNGMSDIKRAFCMGNALVIDIPHAIGNQIANEWLGN